MGTMIAGGALGLLGLGMMLGAAYLLRRTRRETGLALDVLLAGVDVLLRRQRTDGERLERVEKLLAEQAAPTEQAAPAGRAGLTEPGALTDTSVPAEKEAEMSRAMEEGMMNLLQYAAGKVPGVEVSM